MARRRAGWSAGGPLRPRRRLSNCARNAPRQRVTDRCLTARPAVDREPGVPSPPNLRPVSRAGTAPCKGLPQTARQRALDARGFGVAGSGRFARVGARCCGGQRAAATAERARSAMRQAGLSRARVRLSHAGGGSFRRRWDSGSVVRRSARVALAKRHGAAADTRPDRGLAAIGQSAGMRPSCVALRSLAHRPSCG